MNDNTPNPTPNYTPNQALDTTGLTCPEPVMLLHQAIRKAQSGEVIKVIATDPATTRDIPNFCQHLGHELLAEEIGIEEIGNEETGAEDTDNNTYCYWIRKR